MNYKNKSRRNFIKKSALGVGAVVTLGSDSKVFANKNKENKSNNLPREVWIATVSQQDIKAKNSKEMISKILGVMEEIVPMKPDIICLPEVFPFVNISKSLSLSESYEKSVGSIIKLFSEFSKKHNCYIILPTYTKESGKYFNSAILLDRKGNSVGEYRKMFPTDYEMEEGIFPGTITPPVFETDFGKIGIQICFDIEWIDGWKKLQKAGAEIVFWPSAYSGGEKLNSFARLFNYHVVSSTRKGASRVIDITGKDISATGIWQPNWICLPINLEKAVVTSWPNFVHFNKIITKYGQDIKITNLHNEEISIIESLSKDIKVADILKEFNIKSKIEYLESIEVIQKKKRSE